MFGTHLKQLRTELGHSQAEMAKVLCMHQSTYSRLERTARPKPYRIAQITAMLGVDAQAWVSDEEMVRSVNSTPDRPILRLAHNSDRPPVGERSGQEAWQAAAVQLLEQIAKAIMALSPNLRGG